MGVAVRRASATLSGVGWRLAGPLLGSGEGFQGGVGRRAGPEGLNVSDGCGELPGIVNNTQPGGDVSIGVLLNVYSVRVVVCQLRQILHSWSP